MDQHRQPWTDRQDMYLHRAAGLKPLTAVAADLGRTPSAVLQRANALRVVKAAEQAEYLTAGEFAEAMGLCRQAARRLLVDAPFCHRAYRRNRLTYMAVWDELCRWLANPLNWLEIDETKIADPCLRQIVDQANADNGRDRWLTIDESAERYHYSRWAIHKWIYRLQILPTTRGERGRKGNPLHLIKQSDLERVIREREGM